MGVTADSQLDRSASARSWDLPLVTATELGCRNRRRADAAILLAGSIVVGLTAAIARSAPTDDRAVADALTTVLGWAGALWRSTVLGLLVLALAIVVNVLLRPSRTACARTTCHRFGATSP